ncbi:MAG: ABC-F type ribosomal protection protein [Eubacterium sp.]|nr:ABC-F type ribosomal protection protein [Eubacterium sp.]
MALLQVSNLTFCYEGSFDNIFEEISFSVDTDWKLGFIGRNGKGKTTLLNLMLGKYEYKGSISTSVHFDYFPYPIEAADMDKTMDEMSYVWKPEAESWRIMIELGNLGVDPEVLYRPIRTLSFGERTKVMLAILFSGENEFLLIDEPTNHLDKTGREIITRYLNSKKGFILVSHDRKLLDDVCDHMLVLNRETIEVVSGNFSSWWENKQKADAFAEAENQKHLKEIGKLKTSADRASRWADKNENTKIGFDPIKEHDRNISTRAYIGAKTKKMQSRVSNFEKRIDREISEKEGLLKDIEKVDDLKLNPMEHHKKCIIDCKGFSLGYSDSHNAVLENLSFQLMRGERLFLAGPNGCGKSSLIKAILKEAEYDAGDVGGMTTSGQLDVAKGLIISYVNQDTSHLNGSLKDYAEHEGLDYSLLLTLLRKLDLSRIQFEKNMEEFSEGQKKKVLLAASLLTPAHLYIWDEPLNFIDVFSRMQLEKLIAQYNPTMILVEHDEMFREKLGGRVLGLYE